MIANRLRDWKEFIRGYESILKININELDYLLYFVAVRDIIVMAQYIQRVSVLGHEIINNLYIERRILFLQAINNKIKGEK